MAAFGGDGDDAALVPDGDGHLALAAEAIHPPFVAAQPRAAGVAGVVTVLNDLAATGARPLALLGCLVAGSRRAAEQILEGLRVGAGLYGVPVLGGHATVEEGAAPNLSTFAVGRARAPLSARNACPGDAVTLLACLEGEMMVGAGSSFFSHLQGPRRERAAADLALLADAAEAGDAWAAQDVHAGVAGSLLQLCERRRRPRPALDVGALPVPAGLPLERWLVTFLLRLPPRRRPEALERRFVPQGLALARLRTRRRRGPAPARRRRRGACLGPQPGAAHRPGAGLAPAEIGRDAPLRRGSPPPPGTRRGSRRGRPPPMRSKRRTSARHLRRQGLLALGGGAPEGLERRP